jgi:murein DD-endopeptidase MepM/ murein hydrolase activator NlpD
LTSPARFVYTALSVGWRFSTAALCLVGLFSRTQAQEVVIAREQKQSVTTAETFGPAHISPETNSQKGVEPPIEKNSALRPPLINDLQDPHHKSIGSAKGEDSANQLTKLGSSATPVKPHADGARPKIPSVNVPRPNRLTLVPGPAPEKHDGGPVGVPVADNRFETAFIKLANGFDFPVGKPDAQGYYKARGFRSHGHLGEDWDGMGGGDTDLGDPIYSIGDGLVVFARDCHMGWGNVMIVRHSYREGGAVKTIDALYGHLDKMLAHRGQTVMRGQEIATMGTAHGLYDAHLHLEIRKNIEVGMNRTAFARDFSNYYDPSQFILSHRHLSNNGGSYRVAMNTFVRDATINFDKARNFSHSHSSGGTSESAAALKTAIAAKH